MIEEEERADRSDPFDTHPSLKQRLASLEGAFAKASPMAQADAPAASLLPDLETHAAAAARAAWARQTVETLKPLEWSAIGEAVYVPQWRAMAKHFHKWLSAFTPETLPSSKDALIRAGGSLANPGEEGITDEERLGRAV
ncbi:MAG TPA: hypothetical protein VGD94_08610, partial [Vicinamibacterales bacterium]